MISVAFAATANAATTLYTSPTGTATTGCTRSAPCDLGSVATVAVPGDTVILMDGVYKTKLSIPEKTGSSDSAWITFQADECALPIIEGEGVGPLSENQDAGVNSEKATYLRFVGIVSRGWNIGFGNGWTGVNTTTSNGHFEFKYCIADSNGRTGFTFFSAQGIHAQNNISAHNGSSIRESWSSGFTLYETKGTGSSSLIEGNVSFENMDNHDVAQAPDAGGKHSDGNGFIVDEHTDGAIFLNNIAFANGGSCLRLTRSTNTKFINNTCYHNARDTRDAGPSNPGEIYFTDDTSKQGVTIMNNTFINTGSGPGMSAVYGQPTSGWSNNVTGTTNPGFTAAEGTNPDFTLGSSATNLIGKGGTGSSVPMNDIGFDPKCIVKKTPTPIGMMDKGSWWAYSIDYDYIKSIGGVAKCFNPATRSGTPDIGAYKSGAVMKAGTCTPTNTGSGGSGGAGSGGAGGGSAKGGSSGGGGIGGAGTAGSASNGGSSNAGANSAGGTSNGGAGGGVAGQAGSSTAGSSGNNGSGGGAGSNNVAGNGSSNGGSGQTSNGGAPGSGGSTTALGGSSAGGAVTKGGNTSAAGAPSSGENTGCSCRTAPQTNPTGSLAGLGLLCLGMIGLKRRRQSRG
jgi:MYXO-CTERM domain-containing protein